jgi:hypothetical protein
MLSGKNCFLTGEAGTGKSTVIKEFLKQIDKNVVVVAPTGVAAVNVDGVTIHSFFQFPCTILKAGELEGIRSPKRKELIRNTDIVIIDEISMVRSDLFSAIDTRLRYLGDSSKPFGGKQIIATGDFFQLPPFAVSDPENIYLKTVYGGMFAFQTSAWASADFQNLFLTTVHRQNNDPTFAKMLGNIRKNDMTANINLPNCDEEMSALEALNTASCRHPAHEVLAICVTRNDAYNINVSRASEINNPIHRFAAKVSGDFKPALYPTTEILDLKVGERVMTLANKYDGELIYCNGDMGTIVAIEGESVTIEFDKGISAEIKPFTWSNFEYELVKENGKTRITQREIGRFSQMPLRLAYATTIHKSQGLTLDAATIVLGNGCFAPGQLYTALSRVRTFEGLTLDREIKENDLFFAPEVVEFYKGIVPVDGASADKENIMLEVPAEYAEKIKELLAELRAEKKYSA